MKKTIPVTKCYLPSINKYNNYLNKIFELGWITNRGTLVETLENKISKSLDINSKVTLTTNGTLPLQIAIKALDLKDEIITTPFSYVATTSSIVWENCTPIFVDIEENHWTIDANKIEEKITPKTSAILATHIYGNPCDVEKIEQIALKYNLKVIYDAAHAFGVKYNGKSIFDFGDVSTCSFHATKIFHTGEGGAMFTKNQAIHNKLFWMHNFGHNSSTNFHGVGINAKMSELQAAMGLSIIEDIPQIINSRKAAVKFYIEKLNNLPLDFLKLREHCLWNYHYFPILFKTENQLLKTIDILKSESIFPRRYFYPSLNNLPYVRYQECPISESISKRIICLPLYFNMEEGTLNKITSLIQQCFK